MYPDFCNCKNKEIIEGKKPMWAICREHGWMIERFKPVQLELDFNLTEMI